MHLDIASMSPFMLANETDVALRTTTTGTKEESAKQIAALREDADAGHIAEHIRGIVAATMANLSIQAADATLPMALRWPS